MTSHPTDQPAAEQAPHDVVTRAAHTMILRAAEATRETYHHPLDPVTREPETPDLRWGVGNRTCIALDVDQRDPGSFEHAGTIAELDQPDRIDQEDTERLEADATHIAALDPVAADALADLLGQIGRLMRIDPDDVSPVIAEAAETAARAYLRLPTEPAEPAGQVTP